MTDADAERLLGILIAAYPRQRLDEANVAVYSRYLGYLGTPDAAHEAVEWLIRHEPRFPTIAEIQDAYDRVRGKYAPKQLDEAPLTDRQRQENLKRIRDLSARITAHGPVCGWCGRPTKAGAATCSHCDDVEAEHQRVSRG